MSLLRVFLLVLSMGYSVSGYTHYRLPTSVIPVKYDLRILTRLDDIDQPDFVGYVKIQLSVLEDTKNVTLHASQLNIDDSSTIVRELNSNVTICKKSIEKNTDFDYYIVHLCSVLKKGSSYQLEIYYNAKLNEKPRGYFIQDYEDNRTYQKKRYTCTQFEPNCARKAFPSFDEPNFKSIFKVTLGHHKIYQALSNMPMRKQFPHEKLSDYVWSQFEETVLMSSYLVAFSINDFQYKSSPINSSNNVQFRTWANRNEVNDAEYATEFSPKVFQYFEELLNIKYPLRKMDQIAIQDFSGAMENWGLVVYMKNSLLYRPQSMDYKRENGVTHIICHELAHQWFGNLVTMEWWNDLWLNEGFASYFSNLCVKSIYPQRLQLDFSELDILLTFFHNDERFTSKPISAPVKKINLHVYRELAKVVYNRASIVIRMIHRTLGNTAFIEGLKDYLSANMYKNTRQDDLWHYLNSSAHRHQVIKAKYDLKPILDSWTLQPGYPVINVRRNYTAGTAEITQKHYVTQNNKQKNYCWWVPLTYTTKSELNFNNTLVKNWLECTSSSKTIGNMPSSNEWVIFNIQMSAFCRVNYDKQNWELLIKTLTQGDLESIHALNRAQLVGDAISLASNGQISDDIAMRLITYLAREQNILPWIAFVKNFHSFKWIIKRFPKFKKLMHKIVLNYHNFLETQMNYKNHLQKSDFETHQDKIYSVVKMLQRHG